MNIVTSLWTRTPAGTVVLTVTHFADGAAVTLTKTLAGVGADVANLTVRVADGAVESLLNLTDTVQGWAQSTEMWSYRAHAGEAKLKPLALDPETQKLPRRHSPRIR